MTSESTVEHIKSLSSLQEKLQYYNDNVESLIFISNHRHRVAINEYGYKIFCLCSDCINSVTNEDFYIYRDIRNSEVDRIVNFFNETSSYSDKLQYYLKFFTLPENTFIRLKYVPKELDKIKDYYDYKEVTIDVSPKENETDILIKHLKSKISIERNTFLNINKLTYEFRVKQFNLSLNRKVKKEDKIEVINDEFDKINLKKIDITSKKPVNKLMVRVLTLADKITQNEHIIDYQNLKTLEDYVLAIDTLQYEKYLNDCYRNFNTMSVKSKFIETRNDFDKIWFQIGLLFANGKMQDLILRFNRNATNIADHLGNKEGYRPYISESISNTNKNDKNIFSNRKKMMSVINYCEEHDITVVDSFTQLIPIE